VREADSVAISKRRFSARHVAAGLAAAGLLAASVATTADAAQAKSKRPATRAALFVGNNWDGTADVIDPRTFKRLTRIDIIPDRAQRMQEIATDPASLGYFLAIRQQVGEGHDQFVDDMFSSKDGRRVFVSRPSFKDVVAIDLTTRRIVWRTRVDGYRADHMAISPDGRRLAVSASTAKTVDMIDTRTGAITGRFASGDQPHENNFSKDGSKIFHASIGSVFTPLDEPQFDATKGERVFEIVDARTLQVTKRIDFGAKLAEYGLPGMSSAVRPMALSPDERWLYVQLSFLHGFVEYDLRRDRVTRILTLPLSEEAKRTRREDYLLDSAHHGLAMNRQGTKLCAAGTISDYAAIVDRSTLRYKVIPVGHKPYWSTSSSNGRYCFVSVSGDDRVAVVSYARRKLVARIAVGDHPQRMRVGRIRRSAARVEPAVAPQLNPIPLPSGAAVPAMPATLSPAAAFIGGLPVGG
jgi:DNA-binding beta-propeller fold protein YncE